MFCMNMNNPLGAVHKLRHPLKGAGEGGIFKKMTDNLKTVLEEGNTILSKLSPVQY